MRPLTHEQEGRTTPFTHLTRHRAIGGQLTRRHGLKTAQQLLTVRTPHHRTVLEQRPRPHQSSAHLRDAQRLVTGHELREARRLVPQRRGRTARHHPRHHTTT
ncbi:hypothetical protein, partial [Streptomyces sp. NPDC001250]|uniref:hypothetical protein n=1 Tax=Streptomyces sp. NPDC001250 TaxID=3154382 RepID=UPI00331ED8DF